MKDLNTLPTNPGVYKMIDAKGKVIYVGKAKNIKKRVKTYFHKTIKEIKIAIMVKKAVHIETIVTQTEKEALILENQLIKRENPRYNNLLKDDKTYPYIKVTIQDPFPRIIVTRSKKQDKARYYGPYPSLGPARHLKRLLYELFPLRDCKGPITLDKKQDKCLLLDIGKCIGPCMYKQIKPEYDQLVRQLHELLMGRERGVMRQWRECMQRCSERREYEKARVYRDKLKVMEQLIERQTVALVSEETMQVWVLQWDRYHDYVLVQDIIQGKLLSQRGYYQEREGEEEMGEFIQRCFVEYVAQKGEIPREVVCDEGVKKYIQGVVKLWGKKVKIKVPKRGDKKKLVSLAKKNAQKGSDRYYLQRLKSNQGSVLESMKKSLRLKRVPEVIIGVDISHLQGTNIVGAAVYFNKEDPIKSEYRKYLIKTVIGTANDPVSIKEVVSRRMREAFKTGRYPDLLVIDGGKAQLNFAYQGLEGSQGCERVDVIALAKREEEIYIRGKKAPICLSKKDKGLQLLQRIRDESHRFARQFQQERHIKKALGQNHKISK